MYCSRNPEDIIENFERIMVIGDLHADYETFRQLLIEANIMDRNHNFIAKNTYLVQVGDQLDGKNRNGIKGSDGKGEEQILDLIDHLSEMAPAKNSKVFCLIGNHEFMNFIGDYRYVSQHDLKPQRSSDFNPGGVMAKRLACSRVAVLKIADIIFVHAGISEEMSEFLKSDSNIKKVNKALREFLFKMRTIEDPEINKFFIEKDSLLWNRSLGKDIINCDKIYRLGHVIVGHSVQETINSKCNNKLWRTDVGLSSSFGNKNFQLLEIKNNNNVYDFNVIQL